MKKKNTKKKNAKNYHTQKKNAQKKNVKKRTTKNYTEKRRTRGINSTRSTENLSAEKKNMNDEKRMRRRKTRGIWRR